MTQKARSPLVVTEDVYWKLAEMKLQMRARSTDEVLRALLGMPANNTRVKRFFEDFATGYEGANRARAPADSETPAV